MKIIYKIGATLILLLCIQLITFYTISQRALVEEIGRHYESYYIGYNTVNNIGIITDFQLEPLLIRENFKDFEGINIQFCQSISACETLRETDDFYFYIFNLETQHPFFINQVIEGEMGQQFGASWKSKYIWVLYKWVLIEKHNSGIS